MYFYKCPEWTVLISKTLPRFNLGKMQVNVEELSEPMFNCVWNSVYEQVLFGSPFSGFSVGTLESKFSSLGQVRVQMSLHWVSAGK